MPPRSVASQSRDGVPARGVTFGTPASAYSSYFACDWMLCAQDVPGDKADFALDLRLPAGMVSLGPASRPAGAAGGRHRGPPLAHVAPLLRLSFGFAFGNFTPGLRQGGQHPAHVPERHGIGGGACSSFCADRRDGAIPRRTRRACPCRTAGTRSCWWRATRHRRRHLVGDRRGEPPAPGGTPRTTG